MKQYKIKKSVFSEWMKDSVNTLYPTLYKQFFGGNGFVGTMENALSAFQVDEEINFESFSYREWLQDFTCLDMHVRESERETYSFLIALNEFLIQKYEQKKNEVISLLQKKVDLTEKIAELERQKEKRSAEMRKICQKECFDRKGVSKKKRERFLIALLAVIVLIIALGGLLISFLTKNKNYWFGILGIADFFIGTIGFVLERFMDMRDENAILEKEGKTEDDVEAERKSAEKEISALVGTIENLNIQIGNVQMNTIVNPQNVVNIEFNPRGGDGDK